MSSACEKCGHDPNRPAEVDAYCKLIDGQVVTAKTQIKVPDGVWNLMGIDREPAGFLGVRYKPRYEFLKWPPAPAPSLHEYEAIRAAGGE